MSGKEKQSILKLRRRGVSFAQIAETLGIPVNTVKSFCYRNSPTSNDNRCKQCGGKLMQLPKRKPKIFCCDRCRFAWWNMKRNKEGGSE